jgi:hypothetical protein
MKVPSHTTGQKFWGVNNPDNDDEDWDEGESALLQGYAWKSDESHNNEMVQTQSEESVDRLHGGDRMNPKDSVTQKQSRNISLHSSPAKKNRRKDLFQSRQESMRSSSFLCILRGFSEHADESNMSIVADDCLRSENVQELEEDPLAAQLKAESPESENIYRGQSFQRKKSIERGGDKKNSFQKREERKSVRFSVRDMQGNDDHGRDENDELPRITTNNLWWSWWITIATAAVSFTKFVLSWTSFDVVDEDDVVTMAALIKGVSSAK